MQYLSNILGNKDQYFLIVNGIYMQIMGKLGLSYDKRLDQ